MNLGQLRTAVQAYGYDSTTVAQQNIMLNEAYREVHSKDRWPFLEAQDSTLTTTAGVNNYAWPMSNFRNVDAVRLQIVATNDFTNLEYLEPQDFRDYENMDRDQGGPQYWSQIAGNLHLYPTPDQGYNVVIDYIVEPPDMASDTDVPVLPTAYHDILVWGCIRRMAYRDRDVYSQMNATNAFEEKLLRMQEEYLIKQRQTSSHVRKSGFYDSSYPYPYGVGLF